MAQTKTKKLRASNKERITPLTAVILFLLILISVILLWMIFWSVLTSLKYDWDYSGLFGERNIIGLPQELAWNFGRVINYLYVEIMTDTGTAYVGVPMMTLNSILYSVGNTVANTMVPCLAAYMCARFRYKFSAIVHTTVIVTMVIPVVGTLPMQIKVAEFFGLFDSIIGCWIMSANVLGMYFLVFYATFRALPMAYTEAARIDGAGNLSILIKIILPMMRNTIMTIMLIKFIGYWNEYAGILIWLPSHPTLAVGVFEVTHSTSNDLQDLPTQMAAAVLLMIPTAVLFLTFHKKLIGNLKMGGLKG